MYECNALAFIAEQAGGKASDGMAGYWTLNRMTASANTVLCWIKEYGGESGKF